MPVHFPSGAEAAQDPRHVGLPQRPEICDGAKRLPQVRGEYDALKFASIEAAELLDKLEARLSSVLRCEPVNPTTPEEAKVLPALVPVASGMRDVRFLLEAMMYRMNSIMDRLEV